MNQSCEIIHDKATEITAHVDRNINNKKPERIVQGISYNHDDALSPNNNYPQKKEVPRFLILTHTL